MIGQYGNFVIACADVIYFVSFLIIGRPWNIPISKQLLGLERIAEHRAQSADVLLLNEIGLDPGIDHCSALSLLAQLERDKKRVISFTSFCGGLPAPDCADVPLGYKFSWSPRGVLNAALNGARFKLNGKVR
jgi:saccharopine dehydrogenase-like NADP-dependent oxidoreductase